MRFNDENKSLDSSSNAGSEMESKIAEIRKELESSPEVISICKEVNVKDPNSILQFGSQPAEEISKFADKILHSIKTSSIESSSVMLKELSNIMNKFDKQEIEDKPQGFMGKLFGGGKKTVERLFSKYQSLGGEIDRIYTQITLYKSELTKANDMLENMFQENLNYYKRLEKYIIASNMVIKEMENEDLPYYEEKAKSGDSADALNLESVRNAIELLKQKSYELEMARMVSMQTAPQIRIIQKGNYKLISKIHSAFIITIPIFKNGLIQAVTLKRQRLVAESMDALDRTTNELLMKNAQNIKNQSIEIAKISGNSAVKVETLENTWQTIVEGINETSKIEDENKKLREEGMNKLAKLQVDFVSKIH